MNSSRIYITPEISYIPASSKPLSSDIVFITTNEATWIYDVGTTAEAAAEINAVSGIKNIVISHFHPDHTANLLRVSYNSLFVSKYTKRYTFKGTVIDGTYTAHGEPEITIRPVPSSHATGCLCLICGEYAFMGDSTYCKERIRNHTYNVQLLKDEIDFLESLDCTYVCLDHDKNFVQSRETLIKLHKDIYGRRQENNPVISVEDFFNPDGSVKEM